MIRSMTGYGRGTAETGGLRVAAEVKSLNNRFADLSPADLIDIAAHIGDQDGQVNADYHRQEQQGQLDCAVLQNPQKRTPY